MRYKINARMTACTASFGDLTDNAGLKSVGSGGRSGAGLSASLRLLNPDSGEFQKDHELRGVIQQTAGLLIADDSLMKMLKIAESSARSVVISVSYQ